MHFQQHFNIDDVTVSADAGMLLDSNKKALRQAGLHCILGVRITDVPYPVLVWRTQHSGQDYEDRQVWVHAYPG
jgi:putative transposase